MSGMTNSHRPVPGWRSILMFCLLVFCSCSLEDERDTCCWNNTVCFRYEYEGTDRFREYITETRWFLFGRDGSFAGEMSRMACCPQRVDISRLPAGEYTLVCVGNLQDYGTLEGYAEAGLEAFRLKVDDWWDGESFANGDRLYWGECRFAIVPGATNRFRGEMSNVHCVLRVRVEWELVPAFADGYRFSLEGVGTGMSCSGSRADSIGVHRFPPVTSFAGSMVEEVALRRLALETSLVTLRWKKGHLPTLRLWHEQAPAMKAIDLEDIFRRWRWNPDRAAVQQYSIRLLIRSDESVVIYPGINAGVNDWVDGGTFG